MEESLVPSPPPGPVELCVGDCSADFRTQSKQLYSFVVRVAPALTLISSKTSTLPSCLPLP